MYRVVRRGVLFLASCVRVWWWRLGLAKEIVCVACVLSCPVSLALLILSSTCTCKSSALRVPQC